LNDALGRHRTNEQVRSGQAERSQPAGMCIQFLSGRSSVLLLSNTILTRNPADQLAELLDSIHAADCWALEVIAVGYCSSETDRQSYRPNR
jgi:hypothetical protein